MYYNKITKIIFSLSTYFENNQTYKYKYKSINLTWLRENNVKLEVVRLIY